LEIDFKAYKRRCENQTQLIWLQGLYFKQALQSSVLVCGLADKTVVREMPKYPDMPKTQEDIDREESKKAQVDLFIAKMNRWQRLNNLRNKK